MSPTRKLFAEITGRMHALGRLLQGKEDDAANKVRQLKPPTRTLEEVKNEYTRASIELGSRMVDVKQFERRIDELARHCLELRAEADMIERAELKAAQEQIAPVEKTA